MGEARTLGETWLTDDQSPPSSQGQTRAEVLFFSCTHTTASVRSVLLPAATRSKSKQIRHRYHRLLNSSADFILAARQVMRLTLKHLDLNFLVGENIKSLLVIPADVFAS